MFNKIKKLKKEIEVLRQENIELNNKNIKLQWENDHIREVINTSKEFEVIEQNGERFIRI